MTLTTDFGWRDSYVAQVKGVLLCRLGARLQLVDVTHEIPQGDIFGGALILRDVVPAFPPRTVHLAVVDPGVGSERPLLAVAARDQWLVGPDNGLLSLAVGCEAVAYELDAERIARLGLRPAVTATFHGRDLFAPAAAHLAAGGSVDELGRPARAWHRLVWPEVAPEPGGYRAEVVHVDHFGNLITNLDRSLPLASRPRVVALAGDPALTAPAAVIDGLVRTYADLPQGGLGALYGSSGLLEISVRNGSAAARLGLGRGARVLILDPEVRSA